MRRFRINAAYQLDWTDVFYKDENGKWNANWQSIDNQVEYKLSYGVTAFAIPLRVGYDIFNFSLRKQEENSLPLHFNVFDTKI